MSVVEKCSTCGNYHHGPCSNADIGHDHNAATLETMRRLRGERKPFGLTREDARHWDDYLSEICSLATGGEMSDGRYVVHVWFDDRPEPETSNAMSLEEAVPLMADAKAAGLRTEIAILTPANWHETLGTARAQPQSLRGA